MPHFGKCDKYVNHWYGQNIFLTCLTGADWGFLVECPLFSTLYLMVSMQFMSWITNVGDSISTIEWSIRWKFFSIDHRFRVSTLHNNHCKRQADHPTIIQGIANCVLATFLGVFFSLCVRNQSRLAFQICSLSHANAHTWNTHLWRSHTIQKVQVNLTELQSMSC